MKSAKCWLSPELKIDVRKVFESRYKRTLTDDEVIEIANNIVGFVEVYGKNKYATTK